MGVEINERNFPGIPQWELLDFLRSLIIFPISMGEVFMTEKFVIMSSRGGK